MFHTLYMTVNLVNSKYYIGVHSTHDPYDDYLGSSPLLKRAIKKYGRENFEKFIIGIFPTRREALTAERAIVNERTTKDKDSYNAVPGGFGSASKPFTINGVRFDSLRHAADHFSVTIETISVWKRRKREGLPVSPPYGNLKKPFNLKGIRFSCIKDAVDYFGASASTIKNWKQLERQGLPIISQSEARKKPLTVRGLRFSCLQDAADHFCVTKATIWNWRKGLTSPSS